MIKKISMWMAALLPFSMVCAAPVGNPSAPQLIEDGFFISRDSWIDVRVGYEGDFVTDGRMEQEEGSSGRVDCYKQDTNSGTVTLNILDRIDLYGTFGSSKTKTDWRFTDSSGVVHRIEMETRYNFLWAVGGRGILFEWGNTCLGAGGRYSAAQYKPTWLTNNGSAVSTSGTHCQWREWQVNLDISYRIDLFTPYIGAKYSNAKTEMDQFSTPVASNGSGNALFENKTPVGFYLGCSLSNGKYFMMNIEGRLVDEEAITISGDFRF